MTSLLEQMKREAPDAAKIFEDNGFSDDNDIQQLCYETVKELFPGSGAKFLLQRSKVWKMIKQSNDTTDILSVSSGESSTSTCSSPTPIHTTTTQKIESPSHIVMMSPEYTIYRDKDLDVASQSGEIPDELKHRLIRSTIYNMQAAAYRPPFNRRPNNAELQEMAKSLVLTYPCLKDPETGHGALFKKLQKRLYNMKVVGSGCKKEPSEKRKLPKKEIVVDNANVKRGKKDVQVVEMSEDDDDDSSSDVTGVNSGKRSNFHGGYSPDIMARHYSALMKECKKTKPNNTVINSYLNKEFPSRRNWLQATNAHNRCEVFLEAYPCFTNHVEIVEEVRRCLKIQENGQPDTFLHQCAQRLEDEIDSIVYYGVCEKGMKHPMNPRLNTKLIHTVQNLQTIFPSKHGKVKKSVNIIGILEEHDDPEDWCKQRKGDLPCILISKNEVLLLVGKKIVCNAEPKKLSGLILAFLGMFYLLDVDYPAAHEVGLTMLHFLFFDDKSTPADMNAQFNTTLADYMKYKKANEY